jgi:uncharacterized protein YndB with AHSA1/START domain
MTRIRSEATIGRPPSDVFDYVTTPANWPQWHPSSVAVTGDAGHPLDVGERCTEEFVVAGRHGVTEWTVVERVRPERWKIEAHPANGGHATITYQLGPDASGTHFSRTLLYELPNAMLALLDILILRRRIKRESATALTNLRRVLEDAHASVA